MTLLRWCLWRCRRQNFVSEGSAGGLIRLTLPPADSRGAGGVLKAGRVGVARRYCPLKSSVSRRSHLAVTRAAPGPSNIQAALMAAIAHHPRAPAALPSPPPAGPPWPGFWAPLREEKSEG